MEDKICRRLKAYYESIRDGELVSAMEAENLFIFSHIMTIKDTNTCLFMDDEWEGYNIDIINSLPSECGDVSVYDLRPPVNRDNIIVTNPDYCEHI